MYKEKLWSHHGERCKCSNKSTMVQSSRSIHEISASCGSIAVPRINECHVWFEQLNIVVELLFNSWNLNIMWIHLHQSEVPRKQIYPTLRQWILQTVVKNSTTEPFSVAQSRGLGLNGTQVLTQTRPRWPAWQSNRKSAQGGSSRWNTSKTENKCTVPVGRIQL